MKKASSYAIVILIIFFFTSCGERPNTVIQGTVQHAEKEMLYLDYLDISQTVPIDSTKTKKNGSFRFRMAIDHPGIYILRNEEGEIINLLTHPADEISVNTDNEDFHRSYTVSGSPESENIRQLVEKIIDTRKKLDELDEAYGSLSNINEGQASEYIARRKTIIKDQRDFSIHFIIEHLGSLSSIYALYQNITPGQFVLGENKDIQYMKIVADSLSVKYPEVPIVRAFVSDARSTEEKYYNLQKMNLKMKTVETGLLDLELPNPAGDTISLGALKGKTVLLYFWASYSPTSRTRAINLLDIYNEYQKEGFEVYAVSLDNERAAWLNAIRFDEMEWINVSELSFPDSEAARIYNVQDLPTSYLINKEGEILAKNIYGQELRKWLENLLN